MIFIGVSTLFLMKISVWRLVTWGQATGKVWGCDDTRSLRNICAQFHTNRWNNEQKPNKKVKEMSKNSKREECWDLVKKARKSQNLQLVFLQSRCWHRMCNDVISRSQWMLTRSRWRETLTCFFVAFNRKKYKPFWGLRILNWV